MTNLTKVFLLFLSVWIFWQGELGAQTPTPGRDRVESLLKESINLKSQNTEESLSVGMQAYHAAESQNLDSLTIEITRHLGTLYRRRGQYDSAIFFTQESVELAQDLDDDVNLSRAYNNLGLCYTDLGNIGDALEYFELALDIKERLGDPSEIASAYNNIGFAYTSGGFKGDNRAKKFFQRSLDIKVENGLTNQLPASYINMSDAYLYAGELDSALLMLEKAKALQETEELWDYYVFTLTQFGIVYSQLGDYDKAIDYLTRAMQVAQTNEEYSSLLEVYEQLARVYYLQERYGLSQQFAYRAYQGNLEVSWSEKLVETAELLSSVYSKMGHFDSAYHYQALASEVSDSLQNESLKSAIMGLELGRISEENRKQLEEKNAELRRQNTIMVFLVITLFLLALLGVVLYNRYNIKRRSTEELERRNKEILAQKEEIESQRAILQDKNEQLEEAQGIIRQQNDELQNVNAQLEQKVRDRTADLKEANENLTIAIQDLDRFIYKTSHDIRGPLARLMGLCNLALLDVKDDKSLQYFSMLDVTAKSLNSVLVRLITINEINNSKIKREEVDFEKLKEEVEQSMERLEAYTDVSLEWSLPNFTYVADHNLMLLILGNLVENGVKFKDTSPRQESFVQVEVKQVEDKLHIHVRDNGIGIDSDEESKLKKMFTKSVEDYEITGLGLYLVKLSVEKMQGSIEIVENSDGLTWMKVELPMEMQYSRITL